MKIPSPSSLTSLTVGLGKPLPASASEDIPMLANEEPVVDNGTPPSAARHSQLEHGMRFCGQALISDSFGVAGELEGNIAPVQVGTSSVVVSETGRVRGNISAHKISVLGHTEGKLDAGMGEVSLHDTATVLGSVRYGRIQVNGANLNATLERVTNT